MGDSVIRFRRGRGFTTVYNSVAQDGRLSLATRGLFTLMASLPEDWDYTVSGLAAKANASRYEIRKCLEQLQTVGYLIREQGHDETGKFIGNVYVLQDQAPDPDLENAPLSEIATTVKCRQRNLTLTANPTQQNKEYITKERRTKAPAVPVEVLNAIDSYIGDDPEYRAAFDGFLANRIAMKKPVKTARAINTIINRLRTVNHRETEIAMLDKATERNWQSVYRLRPDGLPSAASAPVPEDQEGIYGI